MRKLLFLALIIGGCGDDTTGTGGSGTTASSTTGLTVGPASLEASVTCGGTPLQLSCPSATTELMTSIGTTGDMQVYCVDSSNMASVNIVIPEPAVGNLRDLGKKYNIAINCPNGSVQSITEASGGFIVVESIDPNIQIKGTFASDTGDASGTFVAVAQ